MAAEIRVLYATGEYSQAALGRRFGVHQGHVSRVIRDAEAEPVLRSECRACDAARTRDYSAANRDDVNAANREYMRLRRRDPVKGPAMRERERRWRADNAERLNEQQRQRNERLKREDWFLHRARLPLYRRYGLSADDLRAMQDGRCALTGRELAQDEGTQLDHILPRARGGGDGPANLRWVCRRANEAKRDLTDEEFVALCRDVVARADL